MSDITKCSGDNCPLKESCFRYIAKDNPLWQSWFSVTPIKDNTCEHFWPNELYKNITYTNDRGRI